MYLRRQFLNQIGQTSHTPQMFHPVQAEGCWMRDEHGQDYMDLSSGFSVSNLGHRHPNVLKAIREQMDLYLHTTVYGEHLQSPQLQLAQILRSVLPESLNCFYFLNTGSETIDAVFKIARLHKPGCRIAVCRQAYHGSTLAAESLRSDKGHSAAFRPLVPGILQLGFNEEIELDQLVEDIGVIILEVVQAEAGVIKANPEWLFQLREKCKQMNILLCFDEIQTGIGRTGSLYAFQQYGIIPDLLLTGKALGSGLPISAVIGSTVHIGLLASKPSLSYLSTFGGNPLSAAAAAATLRTLMDQNLSSRAIKIEEFFTSELKKYSRIASIRSAGALIAIDMSTTVKSLELLTLAFQSKLLMESFLFAPQCVRIAPPLIISDSELELVIERLVVCLKKL